LAVSFPLLVLEPDNLRPPLYSTCATAWQVVAAPGLTLLVTIRYDEHLASCKPSWATQLSSHLRATQTAHGIQSVSADTFSGWSNERFADWQHEWGFKWSRLRSRVSWANLVQRFRHSSAHRCFWPCIGIKSACMRSFGAATSPEGASDKFWHLSS